jgi:hypothetical protein
MSARGGSGKACALLLAALFLSGLALFTRHNGFAYFYHPDEPGKVRQVRSGEYNFHHPMLLLATTRAALSLQGGTSDNQQTVEAGRAVSAFFSAVAVAALAFVAWRLRGLQAAAVAGLLLLTHHQLFELAHYMKEDAALLCGVTLVFAAMALVSDSASPLRAAALGAACGIAISGKYLGAVMLPVAALMLWRAPTGGRPAPHRTRTWLAFFLFLFLILFLINLPLLTQTGVFRDSFAREMDFVVKGQKGMTRSVPNSEYLRAFADNTTPALWLFLGWHLVAFWRTRRSRSLFEWVLLVFPFAFAIALSCSPKSNDRYFLPATALFTLLAALGAMDCAEFLQRRFAMRGAVTLCAGVALAAQVFSPGKPLKWKSLSEYWRAFQHDDRAELRDWIAHNLPPDAVIAQDARVLLPVTGDDEGADRQPPLTQRVMGKKYAASLGTLDDLRGKGVTHVIVSESNYGRYFRRSLRPQEGFEAGFARHREFYERLFRDGELLWKRDYGTVIYLHPGIRVHRLGAQ